MQPISDFTNRIIHGDCIALMRSMPEESIDLIVTDPPYLVNYRDRAGRTVAGDNPSDAAWLAPAVTEMYRVLKADRFCVSFYGWNKVQYFMEAWRAAGFVPVSHLVFIKDYASKQGFTRAYHECAYLLAKGNPPKPSVSLPDVLYWRYTGNDLHPTQKPLMAMAPLLMAFSKPRDIVLDPFVGSGTTAVAAKLFDRRYIGIEKLDRYCRIARARLQATREE